VNNGEAGQAAFERVRREIETGLAHWVEREAEHGPYRLRATRQPAVDAEGDGEYTDDGPRV
jgi:hypothetical protein